MYGSFTHPPTIATLSTNNTPATAAHTTTLIPSPPVHHDGYTDYPLSPSSSTPQTSSSTPKYLLAHSRQTFLHYYLTINVVLNVILALYTRLNAHRSWEIALDNLLLKATMFIMKVCLDVTVSW